MPETKAVRATAAAATAAAAEAAATAAAAEAAAATVTATTEAAAATVTATTEAAAATDAATTEVAAAVTAAGTAEAAAVVAASADTDTKMEDATTDTKMEDATTDTKTEVATTDEAKKEEAMAASGTPTKEDAKKKVVQVDLLSPNAAPPSGPNARDIIFGGTPEDAEHKANLLLDDLIALHQVVWKCSQEDLPKEEADVEVVTERLFQLMKKGKGRDLAGMKDVPTPFLIGSGRFMQKEGLEWKELSDEEAKKLMKTKIFMALKEDSQESDDEGTNLKELRKEFVDYLGAQEKQSEDEALAETKPNDVVLLQRTDTDSDKAFDNQSGNKTMFDLASHYVSAEVTTASKCLEAALSVFLAKQPDDAAAASTEESKIRDEADIKAKPRFILCKAGESERKVYSLVKPVDAAEVTLMFVFEVWMEKELTAKRDASGFNASDSVTLDYPKPSMDPIDAPTQHDVLFGRGGMTNSHVGNKRFRDTITLHRPDYIKAIKNDKPNVARRIVRAIRTSSPPGRFLKKCEDGKWRDVGDKVAAEKASQALREKSNAEKRQRATQRESIRSKDGTEETGPATKKAKQTVEVAISSPLLTASKLNYVGAPSTSTTVVADGAKKSTSKDGKEELKTEGLPPNAVDKDGHILVTDWDILAGRGGLTNHHRGNKRFRDIVTLHRPDYIRAPKVQKPSVARVIVRAIRNGDPPGRFLRKDDKTGKWYDIGDKRAAEKTSQALREKGGEKDGAPPSSEVAAEDAAAALTTVATGDDKNSAYLLPALPKLEIGAITATEEPVKVVDDKGDVAETPKVDGTNAAAAEVKAETPADTLMDDAKADTEGEKKEVEDDADNVVVV